MNETNYDYEWKWEGDSKDAFVRRIAYPCESIAEKIKAVKKIIPEYRDRVWSLSDYDLQMGRVYGFDLPKTLN